MSIRNGAWATAALALALTFTSAAAAGQPKGSAPKAPTNLRITASTATSVSLAWDASSNSSSNWWYCVQSGGAGCFRIDPPKTTFTHPKLWPGSTYTFTVVVVTATGNRSAPSNAVTFTTPADTTPPTAPALSTTSVVPTRVSLTWTRSDDTSQVSYTLVVDGSPYVGPLVGFNGLTVPYLQPSSAHTFHVIARDSFGNAAESNVVAVTTPAATDSAPPTAPSNLRFSPETSPPEAWLDWDAASDGAGDPPSELMYEVYVNGALASTGIGNVEDVVYCTANGPNTIAVRAIDTSGNASPFSNELVFTC